MNWFYKIFVKDSELLNALPLFLCGKKNVTWKELDDFINSVRKRIFIDKLFKLFFNK